MQRTCYIEYLYTLGHAAETVVQLVYAVILFVCNAVRHSKRIYIELPFVRDQNAASEPLELSDECQSHNRVLLYRFDRESCLSQ